MGARGGLIAPDETTFSYIRGKQFAPAGPDLETAESWGASKIEDFTWKQLLDLDSCTRCGRCQDNCPAYLSGKKLSPKQLILDLKENMYEVFPVPFLLNPALMTGVEMASQAPVVVLSTIEALTGGNPTITKMRERANTITQRVRGGGWTAGSGAGSFGESSRNSVKAFREQQEPQPTLTLAQVNKNLGKQIANVVKHPTIQSAIKNSELTKQLRQIGIESMLSTVKDAISFNSYEEMKQKMSSNPNFAAIEADFMKNLPEGATEQQVSEFKNALVGEMKNVIKQVYIKQLEKLLSKSPDMKKELSGLAKQIQAL